MNTSSNRFMAMPPLDPNSVKNNCILRDLSMEVPSAQSLQPPPVSTPPPLHQLRSDSLSKSTLRYDDRFVLPPFKTPAKSELAPVDIFVEAAISKKDPSYRSIIDCLRKRNDAMMLYRLLIVLRTNGATLHQLIMHQNHAELLHTIFRLDPFVVPSKMTNDEEYQKLVQTFSLADAYLHLVIAIVSAKSTFLEPSLNALWKMLFVNSHTDPSLLDGRTQRLHSALATLLRLVPKGSSDLLPILASNFPFRNSNSVVNYAKCCFSVMNYAPTLEPQILELLIDKALEIDVELRIEDSEDGEAVSEPVQNELSDDNDAIFELELDAVDASKTFPTSPALPPKKDSRAQGDMDEMANKLDDLMVLLFEYVTARVHNDRDAVFKLFHILIPVFENTILTTHRSKFVQFLLFYLCGIVPAGTEDQHHELHRDFASRLIEVVLDPIRAGVTRQSAACYLASFVSRANYVCAETTCEVVAALLRWAETYISVMEQSLPTPGRSDVRSLCDLHSLFYTVCQAAFYIMCFRGADAVRYYRAAVKYWDVTTKTSDSLFPDLDHIDIATERWVRICGHKLQPLRFCLESVREEFIRFADSVVLLPPQLLKNLDLDAQMQSSRPKRRGKLINTPAMTLAGRRQTGGVGGLGRGSNPLDSFFPFDPYLLEQSHVFIDSLYQNWQGRESIVILEEVDVIDNEGVTQDIESDDESDLDSIDSNKECTQMSVATPGSHFLDCVSHTPDTASHCAEIPMSSAGLTFEEYRLAQKEAWVNALKRPRAPSVAENGSW